MIYFDNSATTYPKPKVVYEALDYANRNLAFNAGRGHYQKANDAMKLIEQTRKCIASFVGMDQKDVAFTSSATEALNIIILGLDFQDGDNIYISPFEHNAIVRPLYNLRKKIKINIIKLPFDEKDWSPKLQRIEEMFSIQKPKAVFLSQVSNVIGLMIDYKNIFKIAKEFNSITILDSAQAFGVFNPDMKNVDYCVFAGHKSLYSSFGVAGIISNKFDKLSVIKSGGNGSDSLNHEMPKSGHERVESGSLNTVAIYGLSAGANWIKGKDIYNHEIELTNYLIDRLSEIEKVVVYKPDCLEQKILGIVSINVEGYLSDEVASILSDEFDIAVRSGYHCSPFVHKFIKSEAFKGTVRVSMGAFNTKDEIDTLIDALQTL